MPLYLVGAPAPMFVSNIGLPGLLIIVLLIVLLFGRGKISQVMGDVAKGINAFKKGMKDGDDTAKDGDQDAPETIEARPASRASAEPRRDARDVDPRDADPRRRT